MIAPDLGTSVVGGACLRKVEPVFIGLFGNVHIAQLDCPVFVDEDIGRLNIIIVTRVIYVL